MTHQRKELIGKITAHLRSATSSLQGAVESLQELSDYTDSY